MVEDLLAAYEAQGKELAEALAANNRLNDEIVWLQGTCQNEARWMDRAKELEALLAEAREALEKIEADGAWDAARIASEALAAIREENR